MKSKPSTNLKPTNPIVPPSLKLTSSPIPSGFKINKRTIVSNDFKPRAKKLMADSSPNSTTDNDTLITSTEEFKFLYKLFVPNKYLIKNNKMSLNHLLTHLPLIIPSTYDNKKDYSPLNLQIHLFLSTIMVKYVNSWYLTKLNTDNYDVLQLIYQVLMEFVRNFSSRVNKVIKSEVTLFNLVDEISVAINTHILDLVNDNNRYDLKIFDEYYMNANLKNSFAYDPHKDLQTIIEDYLENSHIIFERNTDPLTYFRILVKNILEVIYSNDSPVNPLSSTIITNLTITIVSDLVLSIIFEKLSSPNFILNDVIGNIVDLVIDSIDARTASNKQVKAKQDTTTYYDKVQFYITAAYTRLSRLIVSTKSVEPKSTSKDTQVDIFGSSVFQLVNTIGNLSARKPLVSSIISIVVQSLQLNSWIYNKVNSIFSAYVMKKLIQSPILGEQSLSGLISSLRLNIFYKESTEEQAPSSPDSYTTIDQLTEKIYDLIKNKIPQSFANPIISPRYSFFGLVGENDQDLKVRIRRMLVIFNYNASAAYDNNNNINSTCDLNKLLIVNILDTIVRNLYPELT
ncbi:uncharacterized protein RJT21DRAFT_114670 [Scheffersomyces amazonensis]|uniref:uncharacterized protein n=1 Tax=Scheffersomyces amazonensis TaxID=1078765 RepID=UPI00315D4913